MTDSLCRKRKLADSFSPCAFGFESGMWDMTVLVPDHCLSSYFTQSKSTTHPHQTGNGSVSTSVMESNYIAEVKTEKKRVHLKKLDVCQTPGPSCSKHH